MVNTEAIKMQGVFLKKDSENVEMLKEPSDFSPTQKEPPPVRFRELRATPLWVWILLGVTTMLFVAGLITLIIAVTTGSKPCPKQNDVNTGSGKSALCSYSEEANRVELPSILKKVQSDYYALNSHNVAWQPGVERMDDHVKKR